MTANFWLSSHFNQLLDRSTVLGSNSRDVESGTYTQGEVRHLRFFFIHFLAKLGIKMNLRNRVTATSMFYFKRFYLRNSFVDFDPLLIAPACLYFAGKVEETPVNAKDVAKDAATVFRRFAVVPEAAAAGGMDAHVLYPYTMHDILGAEWYVIEELNFYLVVYHPYRSVSQFAKDAGVMECLGSAWHIINDTYQSDLCLVTPPYLVALAALYLVVFSRDEYDTGPKHDAVVEWFVSLNVDMKEVYDVVAQITELYASWIDIPSSARHVCDLLDRLPHAQRRRHAHKSGAKPLASLPASASGDQKPHRPVQTGAVPGSQQQQQQQQGQQAASHDRSVTVTGVQQHASAAYQHHHHHHHHHHRHQHSQR